MATRAVLAIFLLAFLQNVGAVPSLNPSLKAEEESIDFTAHEIPKKIDFKLTFVTNQAVEVFMAGSRISSQFNAPQRTMVNVTNAPCSDIFFKLTHSDSHKPVAVSAIVYYNNQRYATREIVKVEKPNRNRFSNDPEDFNYIPVIDPAAAEATPLYGTAQRNPDKIFRNPDYNTTGWSFARTVHAVLDDPIVPFLQIENEGADPLSWNDGATVSGVYGLRILLPFCYKKPVTFHM